ncbi:MAG TPA: hypothetical protein VFV22_00325 [Candidatus Paceibacterota bacterium]|nr:hypothetical protein [Candidatus Paceibacterota bacterium]
MLYVYYGNDELRVRAHAIEKAKILAGGFEQVTTLSNETYDTDMLKDACESISLFGETQVFMVDVSSQETLFMEEVRTMRDAFARSKNHFIVIEKSLTAGEKKKYETHAHEMEECARDTQKQERTVFALCDAFLERDKKALWLRYTTLSDVPIEEIVGVLFWQIKLLRLAERTKSAEEAGQKPYPYKKAKEALPRFKQGEIDTFSRSLVTLYHEGHAGVRDMREGFEAWILSV